MPISLQSFQISRVTAGVKDSSYIGTRCIVSLAGSRPTVGHGSDSIDTRSIRQPSEPIAGHIRVVHRSTVQKRRVKKFAGFCGSIYGFVIYVYRFEIFLNIRWSVRINHPAGRIQKQLKHITYGIISFYLAHKKLNMKEVVIEPNAKLECVSKFFYLGDTLGAGGNVGKAARARVICAMG